MTGLPERDPAKSAVQINLDTTLHNRDLDHEARSYFWETIDMHALQFKFQYIYIKMSKSIFMVRYRSDNNLKHIISRHNAIPEKSRTICVNL